VVIFGDFTEMAAGRMLLVGALAFVVVCHLRQPAFVPPPLRNAAPMVIPAAAVLGATPAFADKIGDASKKLASASYPFLKSIPWDSDLYAKFPADPQKTLKAIDKALVAASSMDGRALQTAVEAHHKAVSSMDGKGVTSLADYTAVVDGLGRVVAGVPESQMKDVFYAFADIAPKNLPEYIFKTIDGPSAYKAAGAFWEYAETIKAAR